MVRFDEQTPKSIVRLLILWVAFAAATWGAPANADLVKITDPMSPVGANASVPAVQERNFVDEAWNRFPSSGKCWEPSNAKVPPTPKN